MTEQIEPCPAEHQGLSICHGHVLTTYTSYNILLSRYNGACKLIQIQKGFYIILLETLHP